MLNEFGSWLELIGYDIKILNLRDLDRSNTFNPLVYLHNEADIYSYPEFLIKSMLGKDALGIDEYQLCIGLNALLLFLTKNCPEHIRNSSSAVKVLRNGNIADGQSMLDAAEGNRLDTNDLNKLKIFSRKGAADL